MHNKINFMALWENLTQDRRVARRDDGIFMGEGSKQDKVVASKAHARISNEKAWG